MLDSEYDLKWRYPEILAGTDLLRLIVENGLSEDHERRTSAVRAFLRHQFTDDEEVRFKQVDLQNKLLDLFIDVPIEPKSGRDEGRSAAMFRYLRHTIKPGSTRLDPIGAAEFLLDSQVSKAIPFITLEGAPGQGKSTFTQYVCQIHRAQLLGDNGVISRIPPGHRPSHRHLPFRVDLRDLATWLKKHDPFNPDEKAEAPPHWHRSLESFLAHQVTAFSGGASFSVTDLQSVAKLSSLLLVFDGLDEVADLTERRNVVAEVSAGTNRLREFAADVRVIVTTRPSATSTRAAFPEKTFSSFHLDSLTRPLIDTYAEKWITARRLSARDAANVRRVLKQKIELPHIRDLARNPMQLAIVLSLIHKRGVSLPDKRTALYDGYVDLFFDREAEKAEVVRDHRDMLIDVHRYLAWRLHSAAEKGRTAGSISTEKLKRVLSAYLTAESRDPEAVNVLFSGVVDRVVFLVSRVEGTFEFDVQPLREYFAAKHLYDTAPYSPPGNERGGTKPDRFDAIAANAYWLNW